MAPHQEVLFEPPAGRGNTGQKALLDEMEITKAYPLSKAIVNGSRFAIGSRPVAYRYAGQAKSYPTREAAQAAMIAKESRK